MAKSNPKPIAPSTSPFFPKPLYQRMGADLHLTGKADRTRKSYLRAIRQFAELCQRLSDQISEDQFRCYFLESQNDRGFAYGSRRDALSGVKFVYSVTC